MKRQALYIIIGVALVLLSVSCGRQHQAKGVIQDFIDQYAAEPSACSSISIVKFDSTQTVNDSIIGRMRANADTIQRYKKSIKYADGAISKKLFIARITYTVNDAEYSDTYYLDDQISRVVAFKTN